MTNDDEGEGGVSVPPKNDDVICEQPLIENDPIPLFLEIILQICSEQYTKNTLQINFWIEILKLSGISFSKNTPKKLPIIFGDRKLPPRLEKTTTFEYGGGGFP